MVEPATPDPFAPARLGPVHLRNRILKAATFEGMTPGGEVSDELIKHHATLAEGGVGLTTVAYCAVSDEGRSFEHQLRLTNATRDPLRRLTEAVRRAGASASVQLTHCGFFTRNARRVRPPIAPSRTVNAYGLAAGVPIAEPMDRIDMRRVAEQFAETAALAVAAGFGCVEIHLGHGYLLSQFISPATNRRCDEYGGTLRERMRFPIEVLTAVREAVGPSVAIVAKTNLADGFAGGLQIEEAIQVTRLLASASVDAIELSGGFTSKSAFYLLRGGRPLRSMIARERNPLLRAALRTFGRRLVRKYPFSELFFLDLARRVREEVSIPLVLLGGIVSRTNVETAMAEGFDFVALGRALIADPDLVDRMRRGEVDRTRCNACNECVALIDAGGIRCVLDDASD